MRMNAINAILVTTAVTLFGQGLRGAEFYVAPNGDDANPGTKARPFATVERARDEVRALKKAGPLPGAVTVQVRGGTYFLRDTLVFDPGDSGTEQAPVIYQAYSGEEPLLSGGVTVSGWREVTPGRWEATLPDVAAGTWFSQLYVNDQRRPRAFLPKQGYYYIEAEAPPTREYGPEGSRKPGSDRFVCREGDIRSDWHNLGDVEIMTFHLWTMDRIQVKEVDSVKRLVTLRGPTHSKEQAPLNDATWYRVENMKEALTEPGEWYLDRKSGVLTYLAKPGEDISRAKVIAPRLSRLVSFKGDVAAGTFVDHIILRGLTLAHSSWNMPASGSTGHWQADAVLQGAGPGLDGAVTGVNARHCALESCLVRHTGAYAVDFSDGCKSDRVESCELVDLGGGGVKVGPFEWDDVRKRAEGCTVRDNLIAHGGRVHPASVGVWIGHADRNTVEHNQIADFYYSAMSIGWSWGHDKSADRNLVADNLIENIGQGVLSDMGGIYLLGHAPGTVVRGNVIHDVSRARYGGFGIYLDACSAFVTVENNLVCRTEDAGLNQNFGHDNTIRNNVFAYGQHGLLSFSDLKNGLTTLEGNILLLRQGRKLVAQPGSADDKNVYKRNVYWAEKSQDDLVFPGWVKLDQWRLREPDALVADPQFVNPSQDDFRLNPQSPAIAHGFVPCDFSKAGRLAKVNRTAGLPAVARVFPPAPPPMASQDIDEGFEALAAGQAWASGGPWKVYVAPGSAQSITVTDETAAGGRLSLKFVDTPEGKAWEPHVCTYLLHHESGVIRSSFNLRVEPGAHMVWEWRDWADELLTGPKLEVRPDGTLMAGETKLTSLPHSQWIRLEIVCGVGPQATGSYSVAVTLPGANEPQRFGALKYPPGFRVLTWAGFISVSEAPAIYYVDNLRLAKDPQ